MNNNHQNPNQESAYRPPKRRGPRGPMGGRGMVPGEKPKNLKKSLAALIRYMGKYKFGIFAVMIFAACSTVFSVVGPKILGSATTELYNGLIAKIQGIGAIDFGKIGQILLFVLGLYLCSALLSFLQGWIMTGITQKVCYRLRKEISQKINRMPMKYFESRTYGEVLSRITNDVDHHPADLHGADRTGDEKVAEVFPRTAGISGAYQRPGGGSLRRPYGYQGVQPGKGYHRGV